MRQNTSLIITGIMVGTLVCSSVFAKVVGGSHTINKQQAQSEEQTKTGSFKCDGLNGSTYSFTPYSFTGPVPAKEKKGLIGFTYTQNNIFVTSKRGSRIANIQVYGWGDEWPFDEGWPQEHDTAKDIANHTTTLEKRLKQAIGDGQEVMLTFAVASSPYVKNQKPWQMNERVTDSMEDAYAQHCACMVKRWPQVKRVQVWNEDKGFWAGVQIDYVGYTQFYNKVYHAIKAVRSDVMVGGGYSPLSALYKGFDQKYNGVLVDSRTMYAQAYWVTHANGYDAISLDGTFKADDFKSITDFFRHYNNSLNILNGNDHATANHYSGPPPQYPIWWAEYYSINHDGKYNVPEMRHARKLFQSDLRQGDLALWWLEGKGTAQDPQQPLPW